MKFQFSFSIVSILFLSLSRKTTTEDHTQVLSSEQKQEEPIEKPQSIDVPVAYLGNVSETRKNNLHNSLENKLKDDPLIQPFVKSF